MDENLKSLKYCPTGNKPQFGKEETLQIVYMEWVKLSYPQSLFIHIPNEGNRHVNYKAKLKKMGLVPGIPDVLCFQPNKYHIGLAVELKCGYNKPSDAQVEALNKLREYGWAAYWANNLDDLIDLTEKYFQNKL